jgi:hypothetical protein
MKAIRKAYRVWNPEDYDYDHEDNGDIVYAASRNEARAKVSYDSDRYLKTKAIREKGSDIVMFEGKEQKRGWAEYKVKFEKEKSARINLIEAQPDGTIFYAQRKRETVGNAVLLWRKGNAGYVCSIDEAQTYTKEEAIKQFAGSGDDVTLWPASHLMSCLKTVVESQCLDRKFAL